MPSPNYWQGRTHGNPIALVIHTMAGTLGGCDATFQNPASQVSAHAGVGLNGHAHEYVDIEDCAWANGILEPGNNWQAYGLGNVNPNYLTGSIETEDLGDGSTPVSDAQYASVLAVGREYLQAYPTIRLLLGHNDISPSSRANCPGPRWRASGRFAALAQDLGLGVL